MPTEPFIETPSPRLVVSATIGSDTTAIDAFRQGVEMTTPMHRYSGIYKMSAGTDDHSLPQNEFGQTVELEPTLAFVDHVGYEKSTFMSGGLTLPFPLDEMRGGYAELMDGVLEPLTIRLAAAHATVDFPVDAHAIRAGLQAGNIDITGKTDIVVTVRPVFEPGSSPFIDAQETFGDVALPGFLSDVERMVEPYDDVRRVLVIDDFPTGSSLGIVPTLLRDPVMEELVMASTGGIEPMIPYGFVSMPAGNTYDVPTMRTVATSSVSTREITALKAKTPFSYGTDSIAFGGLLQ